MAEENRDWGYDRIAGALANLGYKVCDQTIGNVLQRHGLSAVPERKRTTTWAAFIRIHLALLTGTDFFTAEVLTLRGPVTYYVLFFIDLESHRVAIAGITVHPDEAWMKQIARNVTMEGYGILRDSRHLLHDRDTKYTQLFRAIIASGQVEPLALPARCPSLKRWVRSVKEECLSKVILLGESSLRRAPTEYVEHYHAERNHQGKGNVLLFLVTRISAPSRSQFNAGSDWVGSCAYMRRKECSGAARRTHLGPGSDLRLLEAHAHHEPDDQGEVIAPSSISPMPASSGGTGLQGPRRNCVHPNPLSIRPACVPASSSRRRQNHRSGTAGR
jgi:hypothetical protein